MTVAILVAALLFFAGGRLGSAWNRLDESDLRRLNRRAEDEYREQIHPFE